jgi:D-3-phosphoglycerate dehydrogenase
VKRVLLGQDIHPDGRRVLEGKAQIVVAPDPRESTVRSLIPGFHGVIVRSATTLGRGTVDAASDLQVIGRTGAGVDNIDVQAATRRRIPVCHTPEANCSSVVEHTLALLLSLAKQLPAMDRAVRAGHFEARYDYVAVDLAGKTLGVVGMGRIGREVARRCLTALEMSVIAFDPYVEPQSVAAKPERPDRAIHWTSELATVFERADFVTVHVPHTPQTRHLVGPDLIAKMRPTAYLVNTSRGPVVDEPALARALGEGKIAGAGLDVFETEPPDPANPLLALPNVILTPHSAALTQECVARMAVHAAQGVLDVLEGRRPRYVFNPEVL